MSAQTAKPTAPPPASLLRQRDFRLITAAIGLSALGDWLALVPLVLHLQASTGSGLVVGALFIALWTPQALLAGPAGLIVDRFETRRVLLIGSIAQAAVALTLAFVEPTWALIALVGLLGSGLAVTQPAEFALIPAIVGERRVHEANGHTETARYVGFAVGPLAGGLLAAAGGIEIALLVNAGTFAALALAAALVRARRRPQPAAEGEPQRARDGIMFLFRDGVLRLVMPIAFASLLFMTASASAEVFFAVDVLDAGEAGYGALIAIWTLCMAIGSLTLARRVTVAFLPLAALVLITIQGSGIALPALWLSIPFALGMFAIGGLAHGTKNVVIRTLIHGRTPDRLRGRAYAAYNGMRNAAELVALSGGGVLVATLGARWTLLLAGGLSALAAIAGLTLYRLRTEGSEPQRLPAEPEPAGAA